jgi:hypothetical protein
MGMLDKARRFVRGEPLYKPDDISAEEQQYNATVSPGTDPSGVIPVVIINNVTSAVTTNGVEVRANLQNDSGETLQLQQIELLGQTIRLDFILMANEVKQAVRLYVGNAITSSSVGEAILKYRTPKRDVTYSGVYDPEVGMLDDSHLGMFEFRLQLPVHAT